MKNLWKELAPWIACGIILWFMPNLIGLLIIGFLVFGGEFIKSQKSSHKKE